MINRFTVKMRKPDIKTLGPFIVFLFLFVFTSFISENFLSVFNLTNIIRQTSINAALAVGMTFAILTGGIDLSVGAVIAVTGVIAAKLSSYHPALSVVAPFAAGITVGCINGLLIGKLKMPAFIATLSTMFAARGVSHLLVQTSSVGVERTSEAFMYIAKGKLFGIIPFPGLLIILLFVIAGLILKYTAFGRNIYSVGGNIEAAGMMGVKCENVIVATYIVCGITASLAGLILTARLGTALPGAGRGYELKAILTVVLGGIYLTGGQGRIAGVFWAALTIGLITNMFNMAGNLSTWIENFIMGFLLLAIVLVQSPEMKVIAGNITRHMKFLNKNKI